MTIVRAEIRRITTRRATRVAAGLTTLAIALIGVNTFGDHADRDPDMALAQQLAATQTADCEAWAATPESGIAEGDVADACFADPRWFVDDPRFHYSAILGSSFEADSWTDVRANAATRHPVYLASDLPNTNPPRELDVDQMAYGFQGSLVSLAMTMAFVAALLGATWIGTDWRSGIIESQLVRVPNRSKLVAGKLAAVALVAAVASAAASIAFAVGMIPAAAFRGDFGLADIPFWIDLALVIGRGALAAVLFAVAGASLALLARNTVAGVATILVAFIGGGLLANTVGRWTAFVSLGDNLRAFVARGDVGHIFIQEVSGGSTWDRVVSHDYLTAGVLLAGVTVALAATASQTFIHRDVS